jgi:hypothetical protein
MRRDLYRQVGAGARAGVLARRRQAAASLCLAGALHLCLPTRSRGADHADYRFGSYNEDGGRIKIETHAWEAEAQLRPWLGVKGEVVYDAVSGATPTGAPPLSTLPYVDYFTRQPVAGLSKAVPVTAMHDIRWAGSIEPTLTLGQHRLTPGLSYSEEHDYQSYGASLNYAVDLNAKNTTLNVGWSHNWDRVYQGDRAHFKGNKDTDDLMLGINQLLGPKTVLTANLTYGNARGYLNDPYKTVVFITGSPDQFLYFPGIELIPPGEDEKRPSHRDRYIAYVSLTQYVTPLRGSVEGSYRFFHDSYGINAHTVGLAWYQKIGSHVVVSPSFRYYRQSAASFYVTHLNGLPSDPTTPAFYSADYRLSELESFSFGVSVNVKLARWLSLDASYRRYVMNGLDSITSPTAYPSSHVFSLGFRAWF